MNIKAILLGSAAAVVAFSGARAADAIVAAEPEAVEYVRVCDAFGTGYFYIPGTETCLRIHGYTRFDVAGGDLLGKVSAAGDDTYNIRTRFSFRVSTASETELGTLKTYMETRWQYDTNTSTTGTPAVVTGYNNASEFSLNFAWIQLGGLRVGKDESLFITFAGYAGNVIEDTLSGGYGPFDTNLISYTYSNGPLRAAISLEQGVSNNDLTSDTQWGIDDYMPHVVVGLGYDMGMFSLAATGAYDSRDDATVALVNYERGGFSGMLRGDVKLNDKASLFAMLMYGENSSGYTTWAPRNAAGAIIDRSDETFSVIGGGSVALSDKATFNIQGQWVQGAAGYDDPWSVAANVAYNLVPGLTITPELDYASTSEGDDAFGARLRVQRSF